MSNGLPEGKQIRIRSFYGFGPEDDGYVGWTKESARDAYLRKLNDGDLIMIYGASSVETEKSLRSYVLGFLEVEAKPIWRERNQLKRFNSGGLPTAGKIELPAV